MDDVSDVWGGGGGASPSIQRTNSDVRSTDSRVRGRKTQKEKSPLVQTQSENKPLLPGMKVKPSLLGIFSQYSSQVYNLSCIDNTIFY